MQFTFNEGHIQLPSQWQDQSMQVLVSTDNSGINLVITREAVPQGTLTPELYQETLALYQGKLDGYTEHACREITLAEAPAWLLDYSWNGPEDEGNQGRISQIAVFQRRGDTLLTFTFSTSLSLKNSQKTMLLEVIKMEHQRLRSGRCASTARHHGYQLVVVQELKISVSMTSDTPGQAG